MSEAFRVTADGVRLHLRVTPRAGGDVIEGIDVRDNGEPVLRVRVAAAPDKGRANAAVIALLSRALGVPKSAISVTAGQTARLKTVAIAGDGADLAQQLGALIIAKSP